MNKIILKTPTLIVCAGVPASGKTSLSRKLVEMILDSLIIDRDTIAGSFLKTIGKNSSKHFKYALSGHQMQMSDQFYHDHLKFQSYHSLLELSKDNLLLGKNPVLDVPYVNEIQSGYFEEIFFPFFKYVDCSLKMVFCYASEEVIKKRMEERNFLRDKNKMTSSAH